MPFEKVFCKFSTFRKGASVFIKEGVYLRKYFTYPKTSSFNQAIRTQKDNKDNSKRKKSEEQCMWSIPWASKSQTHTSPKCRNGQSLGKEKLILCTAALCIFWLSNKTFENYMINKNEKYFPYILRIRNKKFCCLRLNYFMDENVLNTSEIFCVISILQTDQKCILSKSSLSDPKYFCNGTTEKNYIIQA